ncbi:MAG: citramalate synthase [Chrysiogenetes bacterium]|nr:citramalate synthase [Chrysiogenetes bacterium]
MSSKKVTIYDVTLRDGTQSEDVSFSVEDKVRIACALDDLGVSYIEGGWPGSNPRDAAFFERIQKEKLRNARPTAFGSTRRAGTSAGKDPSVRALLSCGTPVACIFGKSWTLHVQKALGISLEENLDLIHDTVKYLKKHFDEVFYDAEHFFDGYADNPEYALSTLESAASAGADALVLCDTNGGTMTSVLRENVAAVVSRFPDVQVGIHAHNDCEMAAANSVAAVEAGARQVQGTINGFGERCGNANLISIIPSLQLKLGYPCVSKAQLKNLKKTSRLIYELLNSSPDKRQPYVGESAFAHKGGVHVSAVVKNSQTYEHIDPTLVGNRQRVLVSDLSGKSNVLYKAKEWGLDVDPSDPALKDVVEQLKALEHGGFEFEGAEASFELLMQEIKHKKRLKNFRLVGFRVIDEKRHEDEDPVAEATVQVEVDGHIEHTAALGNGPVNALDAALRKALEKFFPELSEVELVDYKVRVLAGEHGTESKVRVLIESTDGEDRWGTVGVSHNILEASYQAIVDAIRYKLFKHRLKKK